MANIIAEWRNLIFVQMIDNTLFQKEIIIKKNSLKEFSAPVPLSQFQPQTIKEQHPFLAGYNKDIK